LLPLSPAQDGFALPLTSPPEDVLIIWNHTYPDGK
jgi:hypothetical protein